MMLQSLKKVSNATNLKFLAICLMFLDHIHEMFSASGAPIWLTMLGRVVFLFLCFWQLIVFIIRIIEKLI